MRKPNGQSRNGKNWRADVCHPPPTLTFFFLRSFLGADICLLRTLQGIWTNGFVISTFLPLLRCAFLPFAMNSFVRTHPPLPPCLLLSPFETHWSLTIIAITQGLVGMPSPSFLISSLHFFSSLSLFSLPQPDSFTSIEKSPKST